MCLGDFLCTERALLNAEQLHRLLVLGFVFGEGQLSNEAAAFICSNIHGLLFLRGRYGAKVILSKGFVLMSSLQPM